MFEKFIIYAEKNEDNPGYRYELGQYGFMDDTLKDVSTVLGNLSFYVILTEYEKRKRTNRFSTTIYFYNGDDCIYLEGTHSKKIVYEVYEDEDCNKLIESRTISGEEFAELAKEIIRTKKNAYESVRRPRGRMLREKEEDYFLTDVKYWLYNRVLDYFGEWSDADFDMSEYPAEVRKWFRVWKKRLLEYREKNGINDLDKINVKLLDIAVTELEDISKRLEDMDESHRSRGMMFMSGSSADK